ncbi:unnamed protein product [Microthlaspi erraticum]|uniref:Uncharacterized protein n=1 Tax=Microthlaspi erraticum TaxID=1685480 RepID=A0A6D2JII0_9BRAS|nr:unnamed protein product [Microthlaspi erraticum]
MPKNAGNYMREATLRFDQDRVAAFTLRLQRQDKFAYAFGLKTAVATSSSSAPHLYLARANLRAVASRAVRRQVQ